MTPCHPAARQFARSVLATGENPKARNLAAAYLEAKAELDAFRKAATNQRIAETQRVRCALREVRRKNAERLLAKVDAVIAEIDRKETA